MMVVVVVGVVLSWPLGWLVLSMVLVAIAVVVVPDGRYGCGDGDVCDRGGGGGGVSAFGLRDPRRIALAMLPDCFRARR